MNTQQIPENTVHFFEVGKEVLSKMEGQQQRDFAGKMAEAWVKVACPVVAVEKPSFAESLQHKPGSLGGATPKPMEQF